MLLYLLFLFIVTPFVELVLLLLLADAIRWHWTLLIIIVTGVTGTFLARSQGFRVFNRIRDELNAGRMPTDSLVDGIMILAAGLLLVTPGLLTDGVGFSLLIPACRRFYRKLLTRWFKAKFEIKTFVNGQPVETGRGESQIVDSYVVEQRDTARPSIEDSEH